MNQAKYLRLTLAAGCLMLAALTGFVHAAPPDADHLGWRLETQTNNLGKGVSSSPNDWMDVAGSTTTNLVIVPINNAMSAGFCRMGYGSQNITS
jgi:hypothetical protein